MDDLILNPETGDLLIRNNDLVINDGNGQAVQDTLQTVPGEYKSYPYVGCDVWRFLTGNATLPEIKSVVKKQLEIQKFTVFDVKITKVDNETIIDPHCERV